MGTVCNGRIQQQEIKAVLEIKSYKKLEEILNIKIRNGQKR